VLYLTGATKLETMKTRGHTEHMRFFILFPRASLDALILALTALESSDARFVETGIRMAETSANRIDFAELSDDATLLQRRVFFLRRFAQQSPVINLGFLTAVCVPLQQKRGADVFWCQIGGAPMYFWS
jgi:hypothetical protein